MSHYSDMTEGVKSFKEAQKRWKQRLKTERRAWTSEKEQYLQLLEEGGLEEISRKVQTLS